MINVAINGFGRIGRAFLRTILDDKKSREKLSVVAINIGPDDPERIAYVLKYDSVMGTYKGTVEYRDGYLVCGDVRIQVFAEVAPDRLPWDALGVDWVVDCSGRFTKRSQAELHLRSGAKKVLISAPSEDADCMVIPGVNDNVFDPKKDTIVSLGSCTTNALIPILKVLLDAYGPRCSMVTTIHAYTNTQSLLDGFGGKDPRKERAAAINIIPTSTGAQKSVAYVLPTLAGKVTAHAVRVPVANVSLLDVVWECGASVQKKDVLELFRNAAQGPLAAIMALSDEPLVSTDYYGNPYSVTIDTQLCSVQDNLIRIVGWYDNEWGYSERLKDFLNTGA